MSAAVMDETVADLHIHSRFSRATSRSLDLGQLWIAAQRKGVQLVGSGDFTHPGWFEELTTQLQPCDDGLFALRDTGGLAEQVPAACRARVRFMLTVEISSIYKVDGKTRKVHNLVCMPGLQQAAAFSRALGQLGNIRSDGRPILGLDSRDLLELVLETSERGVLIPAHIWTPWFSALGSKSGFDSIEACYRDLSQHIFAVETGLSSDPPMNWRLSALDRYCLVSNSDAHSADKLAREANLFRGAPSYDELFRALRHPRREGFLGTLEFFPEEGKYHLDGHRKCSCRLTPEQTRQNDYLCPGCGKPVTLGVLHRVEQLADRTAGERPPGAPPFESLIALAGVAAQVTGVGAGSKRVARVVDSCLQTLGSELHVLRRAPLEQIERVAGSALAEAIRRMRAGEVLIEGGFDGEYGRVHLLEPRERQSLAGQTALFALAPTARPEPRGSTAPASSRARTVGDPAPDAGPPPTPQADARTAGAPALDTDAPPTPRAGRRGSTPAGNSDPTARPAASPEEVLAGLNDEQRRAAVHHGSPLIIWAGPGTGKTRTLTRRIAHRVLSGTPPSEVLALTFTTRAAAEMATRLEQLLGPQQVRGLRVSTFHALALAVLQQDRSRRGLPPPEIASEAQRRQLLARLLPEASQQQLERRERQLGALLCGRPAAEPELEQLARGYRDLLQQEQLEDLDTLVPAAVRRLSEDAELLAGWRARSRMLCVDEYQDVNRAQVELVRLLAAEGTDLCVIGDADQAIYAFRGADPSYFLRFTEDHPRAQVLGLSRSYRSPRALLRAAGQLMQRAGDDATAAGEPQVPPPQGRVWSRVDGAPHLLVHQAPTAAAEAEYVVHSVERLVGGVSLFSFDSGRTVGADQEVALGGELSFDDFAVLYRTGAQAGPLLEAFERSGMPYRCANAPSTALEPVLELVRGALQRAELAAHERQLLALTAGEQPAAAVERLARALCAPAQLEQALTLARQLCASLYGMAAGLQSWGPALLAQAATAFHEADRLVGSAQAVSLMTLHASKGLEFPVVFIVGCEQGLLPHQLGDQPLAPEELAEERRLLYVGLTRAERVLVLVHAARRTVHGRSRERTRSPLLTAIDAELLVRAQHHAPPRRGPGQLELF